MIASNELIKKLNIPVQLIYAAIAYYIDDHQRWISKLG